MLQIATGKLFTTVTKRKNNLRGTLFTNSYLASAKEVETVIGRIIPTTSQRPGTVQSFMYEFVEHMEHEPRVGILASASVNSYLSDFATVFAFATNCICTPDYELCQRLTNGQAGVSTRCVPKNLVKRFFDPLVICSPDEQEFLVKFIAKLIALPRKIFNSVMRSIRTYVNAMYRIADDLELAYTLLVASVESLAQEFDGHASDWSSLNDRQRSAYDKVLQEAPNELATKIRNTVLKFEHVAIARRFREFVIANISTEYFQTENEPTESFLRQSELEDALRTAYQSRSNYVHTLKPLPDSVAKVYDFGEVTVDNRKLYLTLQGLSRLMRHTIIQFIQRQPEIEKEPYDYGREHVCIRHVQLDPRYWIAQPSSTLASEGRNRLEGLLSQIARSILRKKDAQISDLRDLLDTIFEQLPTMDQANQQYYVALYYLFNDVLPKEEKIELPSSVLDLVKKTTETCCPAMLLAHALLGAPSPWSASQITVQVDHYYKTRYSSRGLNFPSLFETAILLYLAELYRQDKEIDQCRELIQRAIGEYPTHAGLRALKQQFDADVPIDWYETLVPVA